MKPIRTSDLDRAAIYRLLTGLVVPRPIGWISTLSTDGTPNLAPFSFFTVVGTERPLVGFSVNMTKDRGPKDTLVNVHATGEFVVNFVDAGTLVAMDASSAEFAPEVNEFEAVGLTATSENLFVAAPRVAESPAQMECRHERTVDFGEYSFIVGEVLAFHLRDGLCNEGLRVDLQSYQWVGRLTGGKYVHSTPGFIVVAPTISDTGERKSG